MFKQIYNNCLIPHPSHWNNAITLPFTVKIVYCSLSVEYRCRGP